MLERPHAHLRTGADQPLVALDRRRGAHVHNPRASREYSRLRPIARALAAAHTSESLFGESPSTGEPAQIVWRNGTAAARGRDAAAAVGGAVGGAAAARWAALNRLLLEAMGVGAAC